MEVLLFPERELGEIRSHVTRRTTGLTPAYATSKSASIAYRILGLLAVDLFAVRLPWSLSSSFRHLESRERNAEAAGLVCKRGKALLGVELGNPRPSCFLPLTQGRTRRADTQTPNLGSRWHKSIHPQFGTAGLGEAGSIRIDDHVG